MPHKPQAPRTQSRFARGVARVWGVPQQCERWHAEGITSPNSSRIRDVLRNLTSATGEEERQLCRRRRRRRRRDGETVDKGGCRTVETATKRE